MSHFTTIQTQIRDLVALRAACIELGVSLVENTVARGYNGRTHKGEYVIKLKGIYDIAVNQQRDGSYGLTCDWYNDHVANEVGANYGRLLQLYGVHKTCIEARKKGATIRRQKLGDGSIKLVIGGMH